MKDVNCVAKFAQGKRVYERRVIKCGKKKCWCAREAVSGAVGHGPYWYLCGIRGGRWHRVYLGKELDTTRYVDDHQGIDWAQIRKKSRAKGYGEKSVSVGPPVAPEDEMGAVARVNVAGGRELVVWNENGRRRAQEIGTVKRIRILTATESVGRQDLVCGDDADGASKS